MAYKRKRDGRAKQRKQPIHKNDGELIRVNKMAYKRRINWWAKQKKQSIHENDGELISANKMACKRKRNRWAKQQKQPIDKSDGELISVNWAELPRSIVEGVFERLSLVDCISVSNVCKAWRSAFSPELACWNRRGVPSLFMSGQKDKEKRTCISMLEKRAWEMELPEAQGKYCWGSFHDWLILVSDVEYFSVDVTLLNPFTRREINLPRTWDFYHKLVLSGPPSQENSVLMLVNGQNRELRFWVPGAESWHDYKLVGDPFEDAVFCNGSFFLLTKDYDIFQIDADSISVAIREHGDLDSVIRTQFHKVVMPENNTNDGILRYLLESCREVLLVCRYYNVTPGVILETQNFKVYALDVGNKTWERVENLGEQILFLGKCSSRAFSARELHMEMANSIYFSNDNASPWWNEWHSTHLRGMSSRFGMNNTGRKHWGVFKVGNKDNRNFCFRGDRDICGPIWFTAPIWWYCNNFYFN